MSAVALLVAGMPTPAHAGGVVELEFNPASFSTPLNINNPLHPLTVGTVFTYMAKGDEGCEWDVATVTGDTKAVAAGVTGRAVYDVGYEDEDCGGPTPSEKVEQTWDWYAQDNSGNVWYLGEHSEDCDGNVCEANDGSWEAGVNGAKAGIIMLANPQPGDQYYQEYYEGFAEDQAKVLQADARVSLYNSHVFDRDQYHCIVTKEWTKLEPGDIENKFYCPNVGAVIIKELKGKTKRFELVNLTH